MSACEAPIPPADYRAQRNAALELLWVAENENEMLKEQHAADQRRIDYLLKKLDQGHH